MKGCDFSMGIYTEKRDQLIEKIKGLEKRIASDTAKKKTLEDKLKEVSCLAGILPLHPGFFRSSSSVKL